MTRPHQDHLGTPSNARLPKNPTALHCWADNELESMSKQGLLCYARIFTFSHSVTLVEPGEQLV